MKTLISAVVLAAALAGAVNAQTEIKQQFRLISTTTAPTVEVNALHNTWVFLRGASIESTTLRFLDAAGAEIASQAVAVGTTYTSVTIPAPQFADKIVISPTTLSASDEISASVIQVRNRFLF
jgi:hypothetical protein